MQFAFRKPNFWIAPKSQRFWQNISLTKQRGGGILRGCPEMGSPAAAPNLLQTVLTDQNAVFLGFLAVWGPPVGRCIPARNGISGQPLRGKTGREWECFYGVSAARFGTGPFL